MLHLGFVRDRRLDTVTKKVVHKHILYFVDHVSKMYMLPSGGVQTRAPRLHACEIPMSKLAHFDDFCP